MEGKKLKIFTGIEKYQHKILQNGVYKRREVEGRDFITAIRLLLENKYGQKVSMFYSMKVYYRTEVLLWDKEQGKLSDREEIMIKEAKIILDWVDT